VELLKRYEKSLKELMNVSAVKVRELEPGEMLPKVQSTPAMTPLLNYNIEVLPASGHKCARCWNFMPEVSNYGIWENVCTRCHGALTEMGIEPPDAQMTELAS
jgi:isoleucyl-tRNA synthetase